MSSGLWVRLGTVFGAIGLLLFTVFVLGPQGLFLVITLLIVVGLPIKMIMDRHEVRIKRLENRIEELETELDGLDADDSSPSEEASP